MTPNAELARRDGEVRMALSWPPSTNNLYVNVPGRGRVPSKEYAHWKGQAGWELKAQKPRKFTVPVEIVIELCPPSKRAFDPDGKIKCVVDLLVTHQVIADDNFNHVRSVTARIVETGSPCVVIVRSV